MTSGDSPAPTARRGRVPEAAPVRAARAQVPRPGATGPLGAARRTVPLGEPRR